MNFLPVQYATIFPILTAIPAVAFFGLFLRDAVKTRQNMFGYLAAIFGVFVLQHYFTILQYFITNVNVAEMSFILTQACETGIILVFSIIVETFEKSTPYSAKQLVFTILAAVTIGAILFTPDLVAVPSDGTYLVRFDPLGLVRGWQAIFLLIACIWLIATL
jgi:hypothetical protein